MQREKKHHCTAASDCAVFFMFLQKSFLIIDSYLLNFFSDVRTDLRVIAHPERGSSAHLCQDFGTGQTILESVMLLHDW